MWLFSVSGLLQDVCEHGDACADDVMGWVVLPKPKMSCGGCGEWLDR
jgi:hypothetical protein